MTNIKRNLDWDCVLTGPAHPFPCQWMVTLCWSSSGRYQTKTIDLYRTFTINYNMQDDHTYDDLHEDLSLSCLTFEFCWQQPLCASPHHSSVSSSSPPPSPPGQSGTVRTSCLPQPRYFSRLWPCLATEPLSTCSEFWPALISPLCWCKNWGILCRIILVNNSH